jgi:hypothetical protein
MVNVQDQTGGSFLNYLLCHRKHSQIDSGRSARDHFHTSYNQLFSHR